jgi:hypothetical protein
MAGMFYSLQEAVEKLNKTEDELKQIVKEGKLREFRDGPNLLFKVEEVEALMSDTGVMPSEQAPETGNRSFGTRSFGTRSFGTRSSGTRGSVTGDPGIRSTGA